jgi:thiol-disulfide isomerase/thioredoxin
MKQEQNKKRFWTSGRLSLTAFVFTLAALFISSCTSNDTANLTANNNAARPDQPKVTITANRGPQSPPQQQQPQPPQQANYDTVPPEVWNTDIQALDGGTFRLSDYKDKVVVLDLWATWCGPCRLEIPHLVDLSKEYGGKGVQVVGLTTESPQTDAEKVRSFAKEMNINYKLGWARADVAQSLMAGNYSIPQTFVIAPGGRIVTKFRGFSDRIPDMIRAAIGRANEKTNGD